MIAWRVSINFNATGLINTAIIYTDEKLILFTGGGAISIDVYSTIFLPKLFEKPRHLTKVTMTI